MNQTQRNYALGRVDRTAALLEKAIEEKHTTPAKGLTAKQRFAAFKKGEFSIRKDVREIQRYTDVTEVITFNAENPKLVDKKAIEKEWGPIEKELNSIRDEVMLGDAEKALKALKKLKV